MSSAMQPVSFKPVSFQPSTFEPVSFSGDESLPDGLLLWEADSLAWNSHYLVWTDSPFAPTVFESGVFES